MPIGGQHEQRQIRRQIHGFERDAVLGLKIGEKAIHTL